MGFDVIWGAWKWWYVIGANGLGWRNKEVGKWGAGGHVLHQVISRERAVEGSEVSREGIGAHMTMSLKIIFSNVHGLHDLD